MVPAGIVANFPFVGSAVEREFYKRHRAEILGEFRCRHASCGRRTLTERLPELVAVYARKTNRSHQCAATGLRLIAEVLG